MKNSTYDFLKDLAQIYIPAVSALYVALAAVWGLPYSTEIAGTLAAIDVFLGAILKISTANYNAEKAAEGAEE